MDLQDELAMSQDLVIDERDEDRLSIVLLQEESLESDDDDGALLAFFLFFLR